MTSSSDLADEVCESQGALPRPQVHASEWLHRLHIAEPNRNDRPGSGRFLVIYTRSKR